MNEGACEALEAAWGAAADPGAYEQREVEARFMHEQPFEDVVAVAEVGASHAAGVEGVGEGAFDEFAAPFEQLFAACAAHAATVGVTASRDSGLPFHRRRLPPDRLGCEA